MKIWWGSLGHWEAIFLSPKQNPLCVINLKDGFELSKKASARVNNLAQRVLAGEKRSGKLNLVFVNAKRMRALNKKFRKIDKVTDVLSFGEAAADPQLGEVVICVEQAKQQAKRYKVTLLEEIQRLLVHGLLHLLGYDHLKRADRILMRHKEEVYAKKA